MKGETRKYAWVLRLWYGSSVAAAQALQVGKQNFSNWLNAVCEADRDHFPALKKHAETLPLVECYHLLMARLPPQKSRQGQRSDLKKVLQPSPQLVCKEKFSKNKVFLQLRLHADEVEYFLGRRDDWLAERLCLPSKNSVHYLEKVLKGNNPRLIAVMNRRELTPCQCLRFVELPYAVQNILLQKNRKEQIAGIKAWHRQQQQGGEAEKKSNQ